MLLFHCSVAGEIFQQQETCVEDNFGWEESFESKQTHQASLLVVKECILYLVETQQLCKLIL